MKKLFVILTLVSLMLLSILPAQAESDPRIILDTIPQYGEYGCFEGFLAADGNADLSFEDYRVTLYLQLSEDGACWVKPYFDETYATVNADGSFSIRYTTGGSDELATHIHLLLVPSSFTPDDSFETAKAHALDTVDVVRTPDGEITVSPDNRTADTYLADTPAIDVFAVPEFGVVAPILGDVTGVDSDYADYRLSIYVQVEPGERVWPKPSFALPYTEIEDNGAFEAYFATGGNDDVAQLIHLLLIPADYLPTEDIEDTVAHALDYVLITRDPDGGWTLDRIPLSE